MLSLMLVFQVVVVPVADDPVVELLVVPELDVV